MGHESVQHMRFAAVRRLSDYCCILTFRKVWRKSKFCIIRNWIYMWSAGYMSLRGCPVEIQSPAHWNLIGRRITATHTFLFSPSSTLRPHLSHWTFISANKNVCVILKKCCFFYFSVRFENFIWNCVIFNCLIRWMFVLEKTMGIADKPKLFIGFWTYFNRSCESVHRVYFCSGLNQMK